MKKMQCRIRISEEMIEIAILQKEMHEAYLLLDLLKENLLGEIYLYDDESAQKICVKKAQGDRNVMEGERLYLTNQCVDCFKQLIAQCYLNPYDVQWLHYDMEICSPQGEEMALYMRFSENS